MSVPAKGRRTIGLGVLAILLLAMVGPGPASVAGASSVEPGSEATAQGEAALLESIAEYFNQKVGEVTPEELKALRGKGYGIGEIVMAYGLALAASLVVEDGQGTSSSTSAFDEALTKVLQLREAGLGWGEIARELGVHPSTLGQSVAGAVREVERKADELHEAARRAGAQAAPKLRQLGDELRRAAASVAQSAREILPDPAREHFRRALEELRKGLEAAAGSSGDGAGGPGAGTGKTAGGPPGGGAQNGDQTPKKEDKGAGYDPGSSGSAGKGGKGGG